MNIRALFPWDQKVLFHSTDTKKCIGPGQAQRFEVDTFFFGRDYFKKEDEGYRHGNSPPSVLCNGLQTRTGDPAA